MRPLRTYRTVRISVPRSLSRLRQGIERDWHRGVPANRAGASCDRLSCNGDPSPAARGARRRRPRRVAPFQGTVLTLEEVPRPSSFTFAGAWFRAGRDEIHLIAREDTTLEETQPEPGPSLSSGLATHFALVVDDLAHELERIGGLGLEPSAGPMRRGDGVLQAYFRDPDGYVVELFQQTGEDQTGTVRGAVRS
ncbi:MAG: hypothetical protein FJW96_12630 [Actinobacteria bacterium]|nr:hypothetical protein [Actinomycetota bacterium]